MNEDKRWRRNRGTRFARTLRDTADEARDDDWYAVLDQRSQEPAVPRLGLSPDQVTVALPDLAAARDEMRRLEDRLFELEEAVTHVRIAARASLLVLERASEAASAASEATDAGGHDIENERHPPQPAGEGKGWPKPPRWE